MTDLAVSASPMDVADLDRPHGAAWYCPALRKGKPCQHRAGYGTNHVGYGPCKFHFGNTESAEKNAKALEQAAIAEHWGIPREVDPAEGLMEELCRSAGMVSFWEMLVYQQEAVTESTERGEQPTNALRQLTIERQHFARLAADCVRLGLEERRVRAVERDAQQFAQAIRGILSDLGVADDPRAPEIVRRHLALAAA